MDLISIIWLARSSSNTHFRLVRVGQWLHGDHFSFHLGMELVEEFVVLSLLLGKIIFGFHLFTLGIPDAKKAENDLANKCSEQVSLIFVKLYLGIYTSIFVQMSSCVRVLFITFRWCKIKRIRISHAANHWSLRIKMALDVVHLLCILFQVHSTNIRTCQ